MLAVCKDHKLRAWSLSSYECVLATDLVQFTAESGRQMVAGSQGHRISIMQGEQVGKVQVVTIYLCFQQHSQFLMVRVSSQAGQFTVAPVTTVYSPDYDLVGFSASERGLVGMWTSSEGDTLVRRTVVGGVGWDSVTSTDMEMLAHQEHF